ncbi:hypothetical protein, partial [Enterococcus casseliflavus]|uniref:ATP-dependent DNA ligase n=1 Tax=Enterococcus casseliflavus TaxID=37734 RepID=UPI003D097A63
FLEPQLASAATAAPEGDEWLHELKFDGYRILARREGDAVSLLSRRRNEWTDKFPTVKRALLGLAARTALVDGEVAAVLPDGRT